MKKLVYEQNKRVDTVVQANKEKRDGFETLCIFINDFMENFGLLANAALLLISGFGFYYYSLDKDPFSLTYSVPAFALIAFIDILNIIYLKKKAIFSVKKIIVARENEDVDLLCRAKAELALQSKILAMLASSKVRKELKKATRQNKVNDLIARYEKEIQAYEKHLN